MLVLLIFLHLDVVFLWSLYFFVACIIRFVICVPVTSLSVFCVFVAIVMCAFSCCLMVCVCVVDCGLLWTDLWCVY